MSSPSSSKAMRSIASYTRRSELKSQFGPVNSGISAFSCESSMARASSTDASLGKQLVEDRKDLRRLADPPHREMRVRRGDLAVGAPQIAVARQPGQAATHAVTDLDIGEILAQRQHLAPEQLYAAAAVGTVIVAVGGLCRVDIPAVCRIPRSRHLQHLFQRR